ncbi:MAG: glycoside hydrolase family 3 N-terminal domain-containing protein [Eubacteriales bacterium]|nr:glycoside hydrolase family 3 N-terminal domain-containing protein [Eubacteriales bacterium]
MRKVQRILLLFALSFFLAACGQMITDEPTVPIPKRDELKKQEAKAKEDKEKEQKKEEKAEENSEQQTPVEQKKIDNIDEMLSQMSLEEKVGQMFLARCPDVGALEAIKKYHFGGYILFGRDFKDKSKEQVIQMIQSYQNASPLRMWIAVDEEGGTVNRVSRNPALRITPFASPQSLYQNGGFERITNDTEEKADLLLSLGINLNMAPVCDIPEKESDFIYERSFGTDAKLVEEYAALMVKDMNRKKLASVLKHFPGYGSNVDTHTDFAYDKRPLETFKTRDFLPFLAGIKSGAGAILVSHNVMTQVDEKMPASLSTAVHKLLRKDLAFQGVIMTDDLLMDAVKKLMSEEEAAILAVLSGNDMLISSSYEVQIPAVVEAVRSGRIQEKQIDEAVKRILVWKQAFLIQD